MTQPSLISPQFRTLITQPTTLCNLNCGYCYLPARDKQILMPVRVAQRLAESVVEQNGADVVEVVWHGGEPLTTPIAHMRNLLDPFEELRRDGRIVHVVQTNATLVDDRWLSLIGDYQISVGVSIDGPGDRFNADRVDWAGKPSTRKIMHGVRCLRAVGVPFSVICVVTADTITRADELLAFFADLGCESVAFNIEEMEGLNAHRRQVTQDEAQAFWARLWQLQPDYPDLHIRDLDRLRGFIARTRDGWTFPPEAKYEPIPTVATTGDIVLLSPELLGIRSPDYRNFVVGNVLVTSIPAMLATMREHRYVAEFERGLAACQTACGFWEFCRGGAAANRFFEHGSFDGTETAYCRNTRQAVVLSAATRIST
ncbi:uncharacterized protein F4553_005102 [Allocatelliglobosispora scoriae]|uniref:Radical SAM core domain-containing protein n=1 Tax=Allocatelliglobosispora scoriae TaxID=643052 RepID=A0A841BXR3_9ACTN|nr:cyclophane-forming radical SAM peptide maturase AmcB [Allocatelliglobosispora scoriae]MBB5871723.1 uncharacterized protein [Allocatelliglobosispora scoriae]